MGDYRLPSDKITTPVVLVDESGDVYTAGASAGGATEAKQDAAIVVLTAIETAVETLDNVVLGDSVRVQGDAAGAAVFVQPGGGAEFTVNLGATDNAVLDAIAASLASVDDAVSGAGFNITQIGGAAVPIGAGTAAAALRTTSASDDPGVAGIGAIADAAVAAGATGSLNAKLRLLTTQAAAIQTAVEELPTNGTGVIATVGAVTAITNALPAGTNAIGRLAGATTGTQSIVAGSASDVTILAANSARYGASVYNDSTATLYLLLANTTSSATVYSVKMLADDYFEVPAGYTGIIKGIWASATGSARVMEYT